MVLVSKLTQWVVTKNAGKNNRKKALVLNKNVEIEIPHSGHNQAQVVELNVGGNSASTDIFQPIQSSKHASNVSWVR